MLYYNYFRAAISITTSTCCSTTNRSNIVLEFYPRVSTDTFVSCICEEMKTKGTSFPKTVFYVRAFTDCSNNYFEMQAGQILWDIPIMLTIIYGGHVHCSSDRFLLLQDLAWTWTVLMYKEIGWSCRDDDI